MKTSRLVIISDTHSYHRQISLPDGDVLIHCGDITFNGELDVFQDFANWMAEQSHHNKLVIKGNHELGHLRSEKGRKANEMLKKAGVIYLEDSGTTIDGVLFWGSPWQPEYYHWEYNLPRGEALAEKWSLIPSETACLITHGPSHMILDQAPRGLGQFDNVGCEELAKRVKELPNLKLHCFGHIHNSYGQTTINGIQFVNAAICTEQYKPTNSPIVIEIEV
jgi:predicted phosphodiesterase